MAHRLRLALAALGLTAGLGVMACTPPPPLPVATGHQTWEGEIPLTTFVYAEPGHILVGSCTLHLYTKWDLGYDTSRVLSRTHIITPSNCTNNDWKTKSAHAECWIGPPSLGGLNCGLENINASTSITEQFFSHGGVAPHHANLYVTLYAQLILPSGLVLPAGSAQGKTPDIICWSELHECRFQY